MSKKRARHDIEDDSHSDDSAQSVNDESEQEESQPKKRLKKKAVSKKKEELSNSEKLAKRKEELMRMMMASIEDDSEKEEPPKKSPEPKKKAPIQSKQPEKKKPVVVDKKSSTKDKKPTPTIKTKEPVKGQKKLELVVSEPKKQPSPNVSTPKEVVEEEFVIEDLLGEDIPMESLESFAKKTEELAGKIDFEIKWKGQPIDNIVWRECFAPQNMNLTHNLEAQKVLGYFREGSTGVAKIDKKTTIIRFVIGTSSSDTFPLMVYEEMDKLLPKIAGKRLGIFSVPYYTIPTVSLYTGTCDSLFYKEGEVRIKVDIQRDRNSKKEVGLKPLNMSNMDHIRSYCNVSFPSVIRIEEIGSRKRQIPTPTGVPFLETKDYIGLATHHLMGYYIHTISNSIVIFASDIQSIDFNPMIYSIVRGRMSMSHSQETPMLLVVCVTGDQDGEERWYNLSTNSDVISKDENFPTQKKNSVYLKGLEEGSEEYPGAVREGTYTIVPEELVSRKRIIQLMKKYSL